MPVILTRPAQRLFLNFIGGRALAGDAGGHGPADYGFVVGWQTFVIASNALVVAHRWHQSDVIEGRVSTGARADR